MRYRRYITQQNPNGSRTVVSVGPAWDMTGAMIHFVFVDLPVIIIWTWPGGLIMGSGMRGPFEWISAIASTLVWIGLLLHFTRWRPKTIFGAKKH